MRFPAVHPDPHPLPATTRPLHTAIVYLLMLVGGVALFLLVRNYGETLTAPAHADGAAAAAPGGAGTDVLLHVFLALAAVIAAGQLLGKLFAYFHQPPVIGEVVAGILLGPSLLGHVSPAAYHFLLPPAVAPYLGVVAQLGVVLYMFLVGLDLNAGLLRAQAHATVVISHASIIAPFLLGSVLALYLYPRLSHDRVPFTSFALFMGVALSVTAFPVLARILTDRRMTRTELGIMAITCAATDDVTAWCLLAFVVGVAQAQVDGALLVLALTAGYIAFMMVLVWPLAARWAERLPEAGVGRGVLALVLVALLLSAAATEAIGIHALFGAFLLGAVIPHDSGVARALAHRLEQLVTVLFLPAFFAFTGMRTEIGLVVGWEAWLICGLIILVATVGKFGGTLLAARLTGLGWRNAAALGVLMNTRGLMELIVLNIGLDMRVISPTLFAMMVLMAIATTMATTPLLQWLTPNDRPQISAEERG